MGYAILLRAVSLPAHALLAGVLVLALTAAAAAQTPPAPAGAAVPMGAPAAAPAPVAGGASAGNFPAPPTGFFRGNSFANPTLTGFYFGWFRLIYLVGLFFLWVWTCHWIDEDASGLKVRPMFWNTIALFAGTAGFVLALCMPAFPLAFLVMTTAYALPMGLYVFERNQRVPDSGKVLTPRHLKSVGLRILGRLGIKIGTREVREAIGGPPIRLIGKSGKGAGEVDRSKQVESSGGYLAARELIYDAILRRTTDIHLEPKEDEISVRLRVDGVMYPAEPFDRSTGDAIVNIFKVLGAMDITERRKPQDGSFRAETEGRQIDFRVATQGVQFGEKMSLRILDQGTSVKTLPMLGLRKQLMEQVANIVHQPHGMFLSCGPTGAGKSTTLYAALQEIDAFENNIITIEDPVEYKMANVTQIEINTKAGQTFAGSLRSVLRQDPDVLLVGEIRDAETAKIACQASTTGHMVFSTLHANDTVTALFRLIDLGVEPFLLASSLSAILGQRLVRKLCEDCREPYRPDVELLHQLGLPAEKVDKFYRPPKSGNACPTCSGMGYFGRMGVFELLVMTDRLRDMIRETPNLGAIKAEARKNGMLYMIEEGLRLVVKGTTSLEELRRVAK